MSNLSPGRYSHAGWGFSLLGPLIQHARPLSDGEPDTRSMLGHAIEDAAGLVQAIAGEQRSATFCPSRDHFSTL